MALRNHNEINKFLSARIDLSFKMMGNELSQRDFQYYLYCVGVEFGLRLALNEISVVPSRLQEAIDKSKVYDRQLKDISQFRGSVNISDWLSVVSPSLVLKGYAYALSGFSGGEESYGFKQVKKTMHMRVQPNINLNDYQKAVDSVVSAGLLPFHKELQMT